MKSQEILFDLELFKFTWKYKKYSEMARGFLTVFGMHETLICLRAMKT